LGSCEAQWYGCLYVAHQSPYSFEAELPAITALSKMLTGVCALRKGSHRQDGCAAGSRNRLRGAHACWARGHHSSKLRGCGYKPVPSCMYCQVRSGQISQAGA
jgi:hypothetical protein